MACHPFDATILMDNLNDSLMIGWVRHYSISLLSALCHGTPLGLIPDWPPSLGIIFVEIYSQVL